MFNRVGPPSFLLALVLALPACSSDDAPSDDTDASLQADAGDAAIQSDAGDAAIQSDAGDAGCTEGQLACFCKKHACPSSIDDDFCSPPTCTAERFDYAGCAHAEIIVRTSIGGFKWLFDTSTGELVGAYYGTDVPPGEYAGKALPSDCVQSSCNVLCEPSPCLFSEPACKTDGGADSG